MKPSRWLLQVITLRLCCTVMSKAGPERHRDHVIEFLNFIACLLLGMFCHSVVACVRGHTTLFLLLRCMLCFIMAFSHTDPRTDRAWQWQCSCGWSHTCVSSQYATTPVYSLAAPAPSHGSGLLQYRGSDDDDNPLVSCSLVVVSYL